MSQTKAQLVDAVDGSIVADDLASNSVTTAKVADSAITTDKTSFPVANRNLIINGAMQVAQRGTSSTSNGYKTVDRWFNDFGGLDESATQAQADVASGTTPYTLGFRKSLKWTNGNQTSGAGALSVKQVDTNGTGYVEGEVLTFALPSGATEVQNSGAPIDITLTITESMLEGGSANAEISCPANGELLCVIPDTSSYNSWKIEQIEPEHGRLWTIAITGGTAANCGNISLALNTALQTALTSPNSHPVVSLPAGVACTNVTLT